MQPYPRSPDLVWPGHLHGTGCLRARAVGTGFPTAGLRLWLGPGCGWSWVLLTPARRGWGLGWVCLGSVCCVVPLLPAVCGVRGWALVSACFRDLCRFVRVSLAPRRFRFRPALSACVLGPGLGCAPPFLAGLLGCVFCALLFLFFFRLLGVPVPGLVVSPPVSFLSGWAAGFFFLCVCLFRCPFSRWAAVPGLVLPVFGGWSPCACLGVLSSVPSGWGVWPPSVLLAGGLVAVGCFRAPPPPFFFFFVGGGACLAVPPFAFPRLALALWLVCGVVGPSPLLAEVPVCYSPPLLAGFCCRWWWAVPATPGWGLPAAVVCGVWCVAVVCWWGCGWCVVWLVPRHSWRRILCATPRHSWLGFAAGGGGRSPPLLAGVRWRRCCVVCGVWRWCVGGVVAGVWCGWSLATPGGGSCVLLPATPGWFSLPVVVGGPRHSWLGSACGGGVWCVVCGVWCVAVVCWWGCGWFVVWLVPRHSWRRFLCATPRHSWLGFAAGGGGRSPPLLAGVRWRRCCVVCGVWRWCVGGVMAGVWCGWSLATPGGGSCVLLPATPGWFLLPVVVGGPRHSWLGSACGGGVWCVVCGVWRWCVGGVVAGVWCGRSLATPGGGSCVLLPATPGWVSLPLVVGGPRHSWLGSAGGGGVWSVAVVCCWGCGWCVVWLVPRHSWRRSLCATPRHSWLGFAAGGGGRSPPLLAGVHWRRWCACFAWPGRAGRPPGRVLVRLTFSFGRFVFLLCLAPSGLGLPLSLSLLLPFHVGCFSRPSAAWLSVRSRLVCVSRLAVGCSLVVAPPPPPPLCVSRFSSLLLVALVFFFSPSSSSSVRPRCLRLSLVSGPGCPGPRCLRCLFCWPSASRLSVRLSLFRAFSLAVGCSRVVAAPPPPLCLAVFVPAARCCVPCCAVRPWVRCCAALLRVVSPGVVLSCAVLRSFGAAACCAVPSGAARRPGALCSAALCFAVFPRAVCSVLCVFCRGAVVRAVVRRSALCCVCLGVLCCAFPVLSVLCGAVLRCAGAPALCCLCGACCCWRLVLWCAAVCCAVSCGVPWCGAGSGGPWLSAGGVFRCRCPCLAAWSAFLWLVWFAVVPCFPVSCSVVLCCRVVLCCCALLSCCGAVGACFALLWAVVLCCVVLLVGCAVFGPVVVSACCGALFLALCVPCLLRSVRCGALLCWLWCPASLCRVLWRCAVMWCCAVVLCCCFAVLFVFALPSCGLSCGASVVCAVVGASWCGVSLCVVVSPWAFCGVVVLL